MANWNLQKIYPYQGPSKSFVIDMMEERVAPPPPSRWLLAWKWMCRKWGAFEWIEIVFPAFIVGVITFTAFGMARLNSGNKLYTCEVTGKTYQGANKAVTVDCGIIGGDVIAIGITGSGWAALPIGAEIKVWKEWAGSGKVVD